MPSRRGPMISRTVPVSLHGGPPRSRVGPVIDGTVPSIDDTVPPLSIIGPVIDRTVPSPACIGPRQGGRGTALERRCTTTVHAGRVISITGPLPEIPVPFHPRRRPLEVDPTLRTMGTGT